MVRAPKLSLTNWPLTFQLTGGVWSKGDAQKLTNNFCAPLNTTFRVDLTKNVLKGLGELRLQSNCFALKKGIVGFGDMPEIDCWEKEIDGEMFVSKDPVYFENKMINAGVGIFRLGIVRSGTNKFASKVMTGLKNKGTPFFGRQNFMDAFVFPSTGRDLCQQANFSTDSNEGGSISFTTKELLIKMDKRQDKFEEKVDKKFEALDAKIEAVAKDLSTKIGTVDGKIEAVAKEVTALSIVVHSIKGDIKSVEKYCITVTIGLLLLIISALLGALFSWFFSKAEK